MKGRISLYKKLVMTAVFCALTLCTWVAWDNWGRFLLNSEIADTHVQEGQAHDATAQRGKYLAQIGGCIACHTSQDGEPLAGGRRIDTPFGAAFSSNLTPSTTHGLGQWTSADFENALHWGRSRDGRLLLPVFPYNHTSVLTHDDAHAIFTWLQTIKPIEQAQVPHRLMWPLGTQPVIAAWRSLFFTPTPFKAHDSESATWNRGAYLVQGAGHCAACHGQRNTLGSFPAIDDLSGGFLSAQMWFAPSLLDVQQTTIARSSLDDIANLLRNGQSSSAQVSGPMAEFVQHTGQHLSHADALAIATYLKSRIQTSTPVAKPSNSMLAASTPSAATLYTNHCATCHGNNGEGKANAYPALAGNPAVVLASPENLIQMALYGGYGPSTAGRPRPYGMPPFLFTLTNQQIADVLNYIRSQWGNQATAVSPVQVDRVRAAAY